jgi:hypothetical protein
MAAVRLAGATPDQAKLEGMKDMAKFCVGPRSLKGCCCFLSTPSVSGVY